MRDLYRLIEKRWRRLRFRVICLTMPMVLCACNHPDAPVAHTNRQIILVPKFHSGLLLQDLSEELKQIDPVLLKGGALVNHVEADSPAARAGLQQGDVITAIDQIPVRSAVQCVYGLQSDRHGTSEITLDIYRLESTFVHMQVTLRRDRLMVPGVEAH